MIMKRTILVALCILLLGAIPAHAAETRAIPITPTLTFDGTTALCEAIVSSYGKNITVTLELWEGNTLVDSWTKRGNSTVMISERCNVTSGKNYTLIVSGFAGSETISGSIMKRSP